MAVARARKRLTVAEFIEMIRPLPDEQRWELLDGEAAPMAPQSERHQLIVANLLRALAPLAEAKGCRTLPGLGLLNDFVDDYAPIPDVVVRCGPLLSDGYARDPILAAEVLSHSTMSNDRGRKAEFYKTLQTLRSFLLVYQDEVRIEAWQKQGGSWHLTVLGADGSVELPELDAALPVEAIYAGLAAD